jgi:hypothetical protein
MDAVHRARRNAQIATGALAFDHGVHVLGRAEDRVHRAGLDAQRAADAGLLIDVNDGFFLFDFAVFCVQRFGVDAEQVGERMNRDLTAGRALIDIGLAFRDGFGVWPAAGEGALAALGLRQQRIDPVLPGRPRRGSGSPNSPAASRTGRRQRPG